MSSISTVKTTAHESEYKGHSILVEFATEDSEAYTSPSGFDYPAYHRRDVRIKLDGRHWQSIYGLHTQGNVTKLVKRAHKSIDQEITDNELRPRVSSLINSNESGTELVSGDSVKVGDVAYVHAQGAWRQGLVTKVGRSNATVTYTTRSSGGRLYHKSAAGVRVRVE
jgi:hypothetical protein